MNAVPIIALVITLFAAKFLYDLIIYTNIEKELQKTIEELIEEFSTQGSSKSIRLKHLIKRYREYLRKQESLRDVEKTHFTFENRDYLFTIKKEDDAVNMGISKI